MTLQGQAKEYTGTITVGATTPSYDLETEISDKTLLIDHIYRPTDTCKINASAFIGEIEQVPPSVFRLKKRWKTPL